MVLKVEQAPVEAPPATRDELLAFELRDQLAHDVRTSHFELDVRVDGGVAHVRGDVASREDLELLRWRLRRVAGLFAAWDLVTVSGKPLRVGDLGCGGVKQVDGAVGIDLVQCRGVDVLANLEGPLPLRDNSFDHIFAVHVLEHITNLVPLLDELHRVLRPGGVLHVMTPYWRHVNAIADPTHCRLMDVQTFKHWCKPERSRPWTPLIATNSGDNVFADLQPVKEGVPDPAAVLRWFD